MEENTGVIYFNQSIVLFVKGKIDTKIATNPSLKLMQLHAIGYFLMLKSTIF